MSFYKNAILKNTIQPLLKSCCAATIALIIGAGSTQAVTVGIDAKTNIFLASATGTGGGTTPTPSAFSAAAGQVLTFSSVTGSTNCCGSTPDTNADGTGGIFGSTAIVSSGGISGVTAPGALFLAGVFINTANLPAGTAPSTLNYISTPLSTSDASFSPLLDQAFFIGDGLTGNGSGATQTFLVPTLANALVLGFLDGGGFSGSPGAYTDNTGGLEATFNIGPATSVVPVPAALPLFGTGLAIMGFIGWRRKRKMEAA